MAETAAYLGVPEKEVQKIQSYMQRTVSLIMPIAEDESITLADTLQVDLSVENMR